jgi:hypothetical protein
LFSKNINIKPKQTNSEHVILLVRDIMTSMNPALPGLFMMPDRKYNWLHPIIKQGILLIAIGYVKTVILSNFSICNGKKEPLCVSCGVYVVLQD